MENSALSASIQLDKEVYSEWLFLWFLHFQENADYEAYCDARREKDKAVCVKLEGQFPRLAQLYDDWEDIYFLKDGTPINSDKEYQSWLTEHFHLFRLNEPSAYVVANSAEHEIKSGHLLIDITLTRHKTDVQNMLKELINSYYAKCSVEPTPLAIYPLHDPEGKLNKVALAGVKKAYFISCLTERGENLANHVGRPKWTKIDTVLALAENEPSSNKDIRFEWQLTQSELEDIKRNGPLMLENQRRQVQEYLANYDAHVRNTIHGKFPCKD